MPTLWAAGRALIGPLFGAITVASLPEPYRRKAGLPEMPGAPTLMQGAYLTAGFTRFLPEGWINAETIIETLSLSPDSDDPRARTMSALRARMKRGGAALNANWPPASTWTNLRRPGFTTPSPLGGVSSRPPSIRTATTASAPTSTPPPSPPSPGRR